MEHPYLLYEVSDGIGVLTLNRPDKLNCLNRQMWKDIRRLLNEGDENPDVRVQIITGAGRAFCAGDDIKLLAQMSDPKIGKDLMFDCIFGLYSTLIYLQKPLIAAVNGPACGGGCEIVLLCDLAVASEQAVFAQPEARIGAWPMVFATFGPSLVGLKASNEFNMLCEPVHAPQALALGLINRVVPHERLMESAREMAGKVMKSSPVSLKIIKETSARIMGERLYDFWISQQRSMKEVSRTEDWKEGAAAFIEKRPPQFKGR